MGHDITDSFTAPATMLGRRIKSVAPPRAVPFPPALADRGSHALTARAAASVIRDFVFVFILSPVLFLFFFSCGLYYPALSKVSEHLGAIFRCTGIGQHEPFVVSLCHGKASSCAGINFDATQKTHSILQYVRSRRHSARGIGDVRTE
jgi:hypothetical protein